MKHTKWILAIVGFFIWGAIGAVLGFIVGVIIDTSVEITYSKEETIFDNPFQQQYYQKTPEGDFKMSLLVLIACVMKADGVLKKKELAVVKRFLLANFNEQGALEALQILKSILQQDISENQVTSQIRHSMNYSSKLALIHFLFEIAYADDINQSEIIVIQRIAYGIGVSKLDFKSLQAPYQKNQDRNWVYTVLNITPKATNDEIKKAYREMAKKYHPDKVANLGDEIKSKATEKFRTINEAYKILKEKRGIK